jgi:hypothetical protein
MSRQPWASGPGEILRHGLSLLRQDSDTNRRLAMLSIDNSVELMMKTYLGLPRRVTGFSLSRKQLDEMSQSFPELLNAIELHAADKLGGIDLAEIEWYHRLRNELYHQGNGLTVEMEKVRIYAELAKLLFENLFGIELEIKDSAEPRLLVEFMKAWSTLEKALHKINSELYQGTTDGAVVHRLAGDGIISKAAAQEIFSLQELRNSIVHTEGRPDTRNLRPETVTRIKSLAELVESSRSPRRLSLRAADPVLSDPRASLVRSTLRVLNAETSQVRLYDLAKELGVDNKSVMDAARLEGRDVSVPSNTIPLEVAERIRATLKPSARKQADS